MHRLSEASGHRLSEASGLARPPLAVLEGFLPSSVAIVTRCMQENIIVEKRALQLPVQAFVCRCEQCIALELYERRLMPNCHSGVWVLHG